MASPVVLDLSAPIASLLTVSTADAHDHASHSNGAGWLTRGELDRDEYLRFLMMLYHIYETFERALELHATHPVLQPTYNPALLARTSNIGADIAHLLQVPESQWQSLPIHVDFMSAPPQELTAYTTRLQTLASGDGVERLLAHSYVRYLGDLSGGQFVRRQLGKAYGLQDGRGLTFYEFRPLGGGHGSATIGDMKKIKEWYRDGMNAGVGDDISVKEAILEEANLAFELNAGLFAILREPTGSAASSSPAPAPAPAPPPLGEPATSTEDSPSSATILQDRDERAAPATSTTYSVAAAVVLVMAVCLPQLFFYLAEKFSATEVQVVQGWFASAFASVPA